MNLGTLVDGLGSSPFDIHRRACGGSLRACLAIRDERVQRGVADEANALLRQILQPARVIMELAVGRLVGPHAQGGRGERRFRQNLITGRWQQTLSITNTGATDISAPVESCSRARTGSAAETGFSVYQWVQRDSLLDPIRSDPAFQAFVAALRAEGETTILGADAAGVSYPSFFEDLRTIAK